MARKYGIGGGTAFPRTGGTGVPTTYKPPPKPASTFDIAPPFLSYDPAIQAERRAAQRGLEDTEAKVATETHYAENDLAHALAKIKTTHVRGAQDIGRSAARGEQKLGFQEQDVNTKAGRAEQDFNTQLANIGRQFANLGQRQGEASNAAGVLDSGTLAASGAARANNQRLSEAPIETARGREREDLATALSRIGTGRQEISADQSRSLNRLGQDTSREGKQAHRETGRQLFGLTRELQQAKREGQITNIDLLTKEIYAARAEHPAIFKQWKKENPGLLSSLPGNNTKKKKGGK